ncbi:MAG: hypothetical protein DSY82_04530 [Flavobacteriia bacterium]|nr:MAG: hypothetical protein DSY82_04530 [Flavobacteriia bacterium]
MFVTTLRLSILALFFLFISCNKRSKEVVKENNSYKLVWSDEFDKEGKPDPEKWNYELGFIRAHEKQYYTDSLKNVRVENGNLIIEAYKEKIKNNTPPFFERPAYVDQIDSADYTSASITTRGKKTWKYAKIDIRAKLPKGRGLWPAFWMLGQNWGKIPWPKCGEIDIMEHVGFDPETIYGTVSVHSIGCR